MRLNQRKNKLILELLVLSALSSLTGLTYGQEVAGVALQTTSSVDGRTVISNPLAIEGCNPGLVFNTTTLKYQCSSSIITPPVDPCIANPSSCVVIITPPVDPCIANPSSCFVIIPPPVDPCIANPSSCVVIIPPPEDPCIANPSSCLTKPPVVQVVVTDYTCTQGGYSSAYTGTITYRQTWTDGAASPGELVSNTCVAPSVVQVVVTDSTCQQGGYSSAYTGTITYRQTWTNGAASPGELVSNTCVLPPKPLNCNSMGSCTVVLPPTQPAPTYYWVPIFGSSDDGFNGYIAYSYATGAVVGYGNGSGGFGYEQPIGPPIPFPNTTGVRD